LFSLPIQVEGVEGIEVHNNKMDVDEGNPGAGNSGGGQPGEGANNGPRGSGASHRSRENSFIEPHHSTLKEDKPTEGVHGTGHDHVEASKNPQASNFLNLNQHPKSTNADVPTAGDHEQQTCADG
jgi:hypothetical protein